MSARLDGWTGDMVLQLKQHAGSYMEFPCLPGWMVGHAIGFYSKTICWEIYGISMSARLDGWTCNRFLQLKQYAGRYMEFPCLPGWIVGPAIGFYS